MFVREPPKCIYNLVPDEDFIEQSGFWFYLEMEQRDEADLLDVTKSMLPADVSEHVLTFINRFCYLLCRECGNCMNTENFPEDLEKIVCISPGNGLICCFQLVVIILRLDLLWRYLS